MEKMFNERGYMIAAIILVGIGAFLLGGLFVYSFYKPTKTATDIHLTPLSVELSDNERRVYASSRGTRYYPWWCDAGNKIAKENKVWYSTPELAQVEGYSIAKGCQ